MMSVRKIQVLPTIVGTGLDRCGELDECDLGVIGKWLSDNDDVIVSIRQREKDMRLRSRSCHSVVRPLDSTASGHCTPDVVFRTGPYGPLRTVRSTRRDIILDRCDIYYKNHLQICSEIIP